MKSPIPLALASLALASASNTTWPIRDTGTGDKTVQWDHYSLIVNNTRLFSFSGEFHPFRIPVPEIWLDVLEKTKAAGLNTVSFYSHWGYHAAFPSAVDFSTGAHNLSRLYSMARDVGLYVSARPGPYINAELSGGGLALWATTGEYGRMRDNSTSWTQAWKPYMDAFDDITAKWQIGREENGTVIMYQIENEFPNQWTDVEAKTPNPVPIAYMQTLFDNVQGNGITVPITHNMPGPRYKSWSVDYDTVGAGGNVHIYGLDNYPSCWSCVPSDCRTSNPSFTLMDYVSHFNSVSPFQPSSMPEFQAGATNPWYGPPEGCAERTDERFVSLYYRDNVAQRVTSLNLYMLYGGTNWGGLGAPFQTSSYDYSAGISENRTLTGKYYELKSLALFTRAARDLTKTDIVGNSTGYSDNERITVVELRNPDTGAGFYALRHTDPTSESVEAFRLSVKTSAGDFSIPEHGGSVTLAGHFAKILVADFALGASGAVLTYSTAEVLTYGIFDGQPTLVLWVFNGEGGEFLIAGARSGKVVSPGDAGDVKIVETATGVAVNFRNHRGQFVVQLDNGVRVLVLDRDAAHSFWVPALTNDPLVPEDQVVFVRGPYLVRSATLNHTTLSLRGDTTGLTPLEIYTFSTVQHITWNNRPLALTPTPHGSFTAQITTSPPLFKPVPGVWKHQDALPERLPSYIPNPPTWIPATHTTTPNPEKNATLPYLYADDYDIHAGFLLWRAVFPSPATGLHITTQGGILHAHTIYLNSHPLSSYTGSLTASSGTTTVSFPQSLLHNGTENVILVVQDTSGHEQGSAALRPRGILNATLIGTSAGGGISSWHLAGTAGRSVGLDIDPIRTHYTHGGLAAERLGWHLPGFDDSSWDEGSPSDGFKGEGVMFYRNIVPLDTPEGHDVSLSIRLGLLAGNDNCTDFRAYVYVNGYQYGKYLPQFAPLRNTFPVPPGIWNYKGDNVLGLVLWSQKDGPAKLDVDIDVNYVIESSLDVKFAAGYLQPPWTEERLQYV
ncbi:putative beta-galactosidase b [Colletotrichum sojae]|uniref:beta-galactosidase n=1 Tax=Colletotrichum sojae TaxID=2175907 RepID=A0A8H6MTB6_9PEZI|nr:putative beta-galactosidase b [Colletotrichum sojae]